MEVSSLIYADLFSMSFSMSVRIKLLSKSSARSKQYCINQYLVDLSVLENVF